MGVKVNFEKEARRIVNAIITASGENDLSRLELDLLHEWQEYLEVIYSVGVLNGFDAVDLPDLEKHCENRGLLMELYAREETGNPPA